MSDVIVKTERLTKSFGSFTALDDCNLEIFEGEVFGLLGPNGAGKSTMLRLLLGLIRPTSGHAWICDQDCYKQRVKVHEKLSYLPGDARLPKAMRGTQALKFFSGISGNTSLNDATEIADRLELDLSRFIAFMSTGMRQKLALAITLASESPLLILDEPTANLDPTVCKKVLQMIHEVKTQGRTVIFSSHVLSEVEEVCNRSAILQYGKLVHLQNMSDLKYQHRIQATLNGDLPPLPEIAERFSVKQLGENRIQIETSVELSQIFKWLDFAPLTEVQIEPIGLRAVYDQFDTELESPQATG